MIDWTSVVNALNPNNRDTMEANTSTELNLGLHAAQMQPDTPMQ